MSDAIPGRCIGLIGGLGVGAISREFHRAVGERGSGVRSDTRRYAAYCVAELLKLSRLPIVNPVEELQREIDTRGLRRVALFGTPFTMESGLFGLLRGVDVVASAPHEIDFVHQTYMQLVGTGVAGLNTQREGLSRLAHKLMEREGIQAVVLAGTELALVFNESNTDFPHLDCARLHLRAVVQLALD